ncbi:hypothetical protein T285_02685 [Lactobacillus johnsonii N6.2]|jgi:hypothetical protein|uniref:Uncharacterized protein n=1 Tax=Lactobacillus johnsonii N6.2 TaxID=1408186 RepID=A0A7D9N8Q5_LACJH|nr:hypothetical protein T285_02685 [Lactobacillus johnsonii N6.2]
MAILDGRSFAYIKPRNKEIKHGLKSIKRMYKLNLKIG